MPDEPTPRIEAACTTATAFDTGTRLGLMQALALRGIFTAVEDIPEITDPITSDEAEDFVTAQLDPMAEFHLVNQRNLCWLRLIAARTPEQRLSLERLINALGIGIGMCRHEAAAQMIQNNCAAREAARLQVAKDRALNRWRGFGAQACTAMPAGSHDHRDGCDTARASRRPAPVLSRESESSHPQALS